MLAMQYSFTLPADYDMAIITRRIADNGARMDGFPGLLFKAYLYACGSGPTALDRENVYAPFYLWQEAEDMYRFLSGEGFKALTGAFGWPRVQTYPVLAAELSPHISEARFAAGETRSLAPYSDLRGLDKLPGMEEVLAQVVAWDPRRWEVIRFSLHRHAPANANDGARRYQVGHISLAAKPGPLA